MIKIYEGGFYPEGSSEDEVLAKIEREVKGVDRAKIAFDPKTIEVANESDFDGYCTVHLSTGYSYLIKEKIETIVKEANEAASQISDEK